MYCRYCEAGDTRIINRSKCVFDVKAIPKTSAKIHSTGKPM
jgi:hypothetical protein